MVTLMKTLSKQFLKRQPRGKVDQQDYRYNTTYKLYWFGVTEYGHRSNAVFSKQQFPSEQRFLLLLICQIKGKPFGIVYLEANENEKRPKGRGKVSAKQIQSQTG